MNNTKITPFIWFAADGGQLTNIITYYGNVFGENFKAGKIQSLGQTPSGTTETCEISIFEHKYALMCTASAHHALNDSISFMINCKDQAEIDHYWNYFTKEGKESQCGWCIDKYGLRWQVIPSNMRELLSKPNGMGVMMQQTKIVIEDYLK